MIHNRAAANSAAGGEEARWYEKSLALFCEGDLVICVSQSKG
jgi:hypothetical protein